MVIQYNGTAREVPDQSSVTHMLRFLEIAERGIAVAVNDAVIPRSLWDRHILAEHDRVLVIRAAQGG